MKNFLAVLLVAVSLNGFAQQKQLEWHTDVSKAIKISMDNEKPLFFFFTGSDWCGWCIRLKKEVFNYPEFEAWTKDNVVLVELDFPRRKTIDPKILNQNRELARIFGVSGYPTVWFVNPQKLDTNKLNFIKLGKLGYLAGGTNKWISTAEIFLNTN
jgi:protein disulfide-isomerase